MKRYESYFDKLNLDNLSIKELKDLQKEYKDKFHKYLDPRDKAILQDIEDKIRGFKVDGKEGRFKKSTKGHQLYKVKKNK